MTFANILTFCSHAGLVDGDLPDSVDKDAVAIAREADGRQYQSVERLSETSARVNSSTCLRSSTVRSESSRPTTTTTNKIIHFCLRLALCIKKSGLK